LSLESALALIESVRDYRVLFIGDTIIDEYHYVESLGKSPKEHLIPMRYVSEEVFDGGVKAASKHAVTFCKDVMVWSGNKVTRKVRMVDKTYLRKLAEIHYEEDEVLQYHEEPRFVDATILTDFGHGFLSAPRIMDLCKNTTFLAVNAQTNSANIGYNLITKYPRSEYIVIDEPEARLAAGNRDGHIEDVMQNLAHGRCERFVVTHGTKGAYGYDHGKFYHQPAFTDRVVDTMGAGDAFFAITAPMAKTGSMEDLLLIGCAAGAIKCGIVGHRESVTKEKLIEFLKANDAR
jgi:bifunctional ADP-heptose synthase (sugar kinase/adenylyltransferase)